MEKYIELVQTYATEFGLKILAAPCRIYNRKMGSQKAKKSSRKPNEKREC